MPISRTWSVMWAIGPTRQQKKALNSSLPGISITTDSSTKSSILCKNADSELFVWITDNRTAPLKYRADGYLRARTPEGQTIRLILKTPVDSLPLNPTILSKINNSSIFSNTLYY